jgi:predicted component of type VI protein secretion system
MVLRRDPKARRKTLELVLQHSAFTVGTMAVHLLRQDEEEVILTFQEEGLWIAVGPMPPFMTQAMATRAQLGDNMMGLVH